MPGVQSLPPIARTLAALALVGFVLLLMHLAAAVLVPVLFAFFLAALAMPPFRALQRRGVKRGLALFLLIVALFGGGIALVVLMLTSVTHLQTGLQLYGDLLVARLAEFEAALAERGIVLGVGSGEAASAGATLLSGLLKGIASAASNAIVSLVVVVFFLLESQRVVQLLRSDWVQDRPLLKEMSQLARTAVQYFGIRTRLNLVTGVGVTLICLLLGVDYALLWGVLAFVLSYIPYIGLFTAMIPPTLLALAELGWVQAAIVVIGITVLNLSIENILEPGYTGRRLELSPTIVFLSFFFWAWLLGPVGALLSMPITVMLMLVSQQDESTRWLAQLIGREVGPKIVREKA